MSTSSEVELVASKYSSDAAVNGITMGLGMKTGAFLDH